MPDDEILHSALKHGVSVEDIRHALRMRVWAGWRDGDPAVQEITGPRHDGVLIEIARRRQRNGSWRIFHAMNETAAWRERRERG